MPPAIVTLKRDSDSTGLLRAHVLLGIYLRPKVSVCV